MFKTIRFSVLIIALSIFTGVFGQNKIPVDHRVYDSWKSIEGQIISNDGNYISYEVNPQEGDGSLYIYNIEENEATTIPRGKGAKFSPNSSFVVFKIVPQFDTLRKQLSTK